MPGVRTRDLLKYTQTYILSTKALLSTLTMHLQGPTFYRSPPESLEGPSDEYSVIETLLEVSRLL